MVNLDRDVIPSSVQVDNSNPAPEILPQEVYESQSSGSTGDQGNVELPVSLPSNDPQEVTVPIQPQQDSSDHVEKVVTPSKQKASRLECELKRLGSYNQPGNLETPLPTSRTRSGKV